MQTGFSIVFGILVILFYFANPRNNINRWCTIAGVFFWVGIVKQAMMFEIIPLLHTVFGMTGLSERFAPIHSVCTWAIYTLAMPAILIAGLYFGSLYKLHPKYMHFLKFAAYTPGLILSFFFSPLLFGEYQLNSSSFWLTYAAYNFSFGIAFAFIAIRGIRTEKSTMLKKQKQRVMLVFLPLLCYWLISVFVPRLIDVFYPSDLQSNIFELWQANIFLTLICIFIFIVIAFKDGFMGLRLVSQRYDWNANMDLINISAEYTNHMFKQQAATMELCINQLREHYISSDSGQEVLERLDILSRSISTLKSFADRIKRHSQIIQLAEEPCKITGLLANATPPAKDSGISIHIEIPENLFLICDRVHMTEVFANIITNAIEAIPKNGIIEISGVYEKSKYRLMFTDNGEGIDSDKLNEIFKPHFSTKKSTEKNFGLGLYYCKNVITEHGGSIFVESIRGKGTTVIITFSSKRVSMSSESGGIMVPKTLNSTEAERKNG